MYVDYLLISLWSSGIGGTRRGSGRGEALQEELSTGGEQVGAECRSWHGTSKPCLLLWLAKQREKWEEAGITGNTIWVVPHAAPQLFGPLSLKSIAKPSLPHAKGRQGRALSYEAGTHTWIAHCYQFILMYTHIRRCSSENPLINSWYGRIFKSELWLSDPEYSAFPKSGTGKKLSNDSATWCFLNMHAVWSILMIRGTPKPIPKLSIYNHQWEKYNTGDLCTLC